MYGLPLGVKVKELFNLPITLVSAEAHVAHNNNKRHRLQVTRNPNCGIRLDVIAIILDLPSRSQTGIIRR